MSAVFSARELRPLSGNLAASYAGFATDSLNIQLYAFILPALISMWHLDPGKAGVLASAALLASGIGGWFAGILADRFGRMRILRISILWLALSSVACAASSNSSEILIGRLAQGLGLGAEWAIGIVYVSEIAPPALRGRVLGTLQGAWAFGWAFAAVAFGSVASLVPSELSWRVTLLAGVIPAIAVAAMRWRMAESPLFLPAREPAPFRAIFNPETIGATLRGTLLAVGVHGGYWGIAIWWPTMLRLERGLTALTFAFHMGLLIAGSFIGYLVGAWASDRFGRRPTLIVFAVLAMILSTACTQFSLRNEVLLALTPFLGLFALGIYSAVGPVLTELFETPVRAAGTCFAYNMGRAVAGSIPIAVGSSAVAVGYSRAIGCFVAISYGLVLIAVGWIIETRAINLNAVGLTDRRNRSFQSD